MDFYGAISLKQQRRIKPFFKCLNCLKCVSFELNKKFEWLLISMFTKVQFNLYQYLESGYIKEKLGLLVVVFSLIYPE